MTAARRLESRVRAEVRNAGREAGRWMVPLARFGYAAKGVVYALVGLLALLSALESRQRDASSRGAMRSILGESQGPLLLGQSGVREEN